VLGLILVAVSWVYTRFKEVLLGPATGTAGRPLDAGIDLPPKNAANREAV
jgi:hypothetical protein